MKLLPSDIQTLESQLNEHIKADASVTADAYFRSIFMQAPVSIVLYKGPSFIVEAVNERALETWGIQRDKVINKSLFEISPELREQGMEKLLNQVYRTGEPYVAREFPAQYSRNGKVHHGFFNFVLKPVRDSNGTIIGVTSIGNEVTLEVTARKAIADSEKRYSMIMMQSPFAFAIFKGKDLVISLANESMKEVLGKGDAIEGKPLLEVLPELIGQPFPGYLENVYTIGIPFRANEALCKLQRNGRMEDAYFNFVYQPYREVDNTITGITCIAYEVTNEVLAKKVILEHDKSLAKLAAIVQYSEDAIVSKTTDGIVTSWNPGATKLFGYTAEEMIGQHISKVIPNERLDEEPEILKRILQGEVVDHFETQRVTKSGKLIDISLTISPVKNSEGKITGASKIARDITAAKQAEATLRENEKRKEEFMQIASHELKTPFTTIKGYSQLLSSMLDNKERVLDPTLLGASLKAIQKQVGSIERMLNELLDVSRIESGKMELHPELFSLNELVAEVIGEIRFTKPTHAINLLNEFEAKVRGDKDRLGQVVSNLLSNAIKYSPGADMIDVIIYEPEKNKVAVSVRDYGIGIDEGDKSKIFERFFRAQSAVEKKTYSGFGIGLFVANEIVRRHGGNLSVESQRGNGSVFTFTLPSY